VQSEKMAGLAGWPPASPRTQQSAFRHRHLRNLLLEQLGAADSGADLQTIIHEASAARPSCATCWNSRTRRRMRGCGWTSTRSSARRWPSWKNRCCSRTSGCRCNWRRFARILGDPAGCQVFLNIAVNAARPCIPGRLHRHQPPSPGAGVRGNTAAGFRPRHSAGVLPKIFDPFFTTKEPGKGPASPFGFVYHRQGTPGQLSVESEPERGDFHHQAAPRSAAGGGAKP